MPPEEINVPLLSQRETRAQYSWRTPNLFGAHGWLVCESAIPVGCDKHRAGTPNHRHGVPALALVTPYKSTNWPTVGRGNQVFLSGCDPDILTA